MSTGRAVLVVTNQEQPVHGTPVDLQKGENSKKPGGKDEKELVHAQRCVHTLRHLYGPFSSTKKKESKEAMHHHDETKVNKPLAPIAVLSRTHLRATFFFVSYPSSVVGIALFSRGNSAGPVATVDGANPAKIKAALKA